MVDKQLVACLKRRGWAWLVGMGLLGVLFASPLAATPKTIRHPQKAAKKAPAAIAVRTSGRDPFYIPPIPTGGTGKGTGFLGPRPAGIGGLVIERIRLEGLVREDTSGTMIAIVTDGSGLAYFLKQGDRVYDGIVTKITAHSVTFTENKLDTSGRIFGENVTLRLGAGPGE